MLYKFIFRGISINFGKQKVILPYITNWVTLIPEAGVVIAEVPLRLPYKTVWIKFIRKLQDR